MVIFESINEWKESNNYLFAKWFSDLEKNIIKWFEEESYKDLEFDYFEFDSTHNGPIYTGFLFFNEHDYQWKLDIVLDSDELDTDDTIDEITIQFHGYDKSGGKDTEDYIGVIKRDITEPELTPDYIFELISEFKDEYIDTDVNIEEEETEEN